MARTKNTTRKAPNRPQRATRPFVCNMCNREFSQSNNYYRHLGLVHRITKDGQPIDDQTYAKYAQYSKRGKRMPSELKMTEQPNTAGRVRSVVRRSTLSVACEPWDGSWVRRFDEVFHWTELYRIHRTLPQPAGRGLSRGRRTWFGRICLTFWRFALLSEFEQ